MKYILSAIILAVTTVIIVTSCGEKKENLLENKGPDQIIPSELYDDPDIIINKKSDNNGIDPDNKGVLNNDYKSQRSHMIDVECISQYPELPTGCEITSLAIVLNFLGYDTSKTELADDYLEKDYQGKVGFDKAFIGSPWSEDGYGCFAAVIVNAAHKYLNSHGMKYSAWDLSGKDFTKLFEYIDRDKPVIVWASMGLMDVYKKPCFLDADGNQVYWYDNEHCMVLCGYDKNEKTVTVADPMSGIMEYNMDRFIEIYDQLEKQAVVIE